MRALREKRAAWRVRAFGVPVLMGLIWAGEETDRRPGELFSRHDRRVFGLWQRVAMLGSVRVLSRRARA
jgi:hypothetical protein